MMAFVPGPLVTFRSLSGLTPPMGDGDFRPLAFGPERAMVVTYQWGAQGSGERSEEVLPMTCLNSSAAV